MPVPYLSMSSYSCDLCCVYECKRSRLQRRLHPCHPLPPTKRRPQASMRLPRGSPNPARGPAILQPPLQPSLQHPEPRRPPPRPLSVNCPTLSHLREHTACGRVARAASKGFALLLTPRAQGRHSYSHPEPRVGTPIHTQSPGASLLFTPRAPGRLLSSLPHSTDSRTPSGGTSCTPVA